jgi:ribosomal protein S16
LAVTKNILWRKKKKNKRVFRIKVNGAKGCRNGGFISVFSFFDVFINYEREVTSYNNYITSEIIILI